jgi:hypothetical protein
LSGQLLCRQQHLVLRGAAVALVVCHLCSAVVSAVFTVLVVVASLVCVSAARLLARNMAHSVELSGRVFAGALTSLSLHVFLRGTVFVAARARTRSWAGVVLLGG